MFGIGWPEMLIVGLVAVLLFGKRLPEVARSMGKGISEFKKGMHGLEDEVDRAVRSPSRSPSLSYDYGDDRQESTAPKFEPPIAEAAPGDTAKAAEKTAAP